ncbi:uncharacterized protein BP5553_02281 [Venustampulla echinocandica]|uniref:Heterokaryon incompatibility domain-containing protein n=1 Tax=Venustampulla echinocandica TaxID=2656787 RepID=A0A370U3F5_9HELO|nr:uncharacterized protein BP5553_02281 [Venustampulla echinocandica]RDL42302.1 hypothetical protein BP5553_02281 [Venustampulla echinocandica]
MASPFAYPPFEKRGDSLRLLILLPSEESKEPKGGAKDRNRDKDEESNKVKVDDGYSDHGSDYSKHSDSYSDQDDRYGDQDEEEEEDNNDDEDDTHDPISCELVPRTFASKPVYECLSYTWGSEEADKRITVNGQEFLVRKNLFFALRQLRQKTPRALWIDAICINQNDIPERNAQVSMMEFVYKRATRVLVWLGLAAEKYMAVDRELNIVRSADNAKAIATHPYWSRLWIIQEVVLAHELLFMHGSFEISEGTFESKLDQEYFALEKLAIPLLRHRDRKDTDEYRLEMLIDKFQNAQCFEKRDKIFGLLGLANDVDDEIEVDYEVKLFDLYRNLLDFHQAGKPIYEGFFASEIKPEVDRAIRLMKISSLVQKMFEGAVDEEAKLRRDQGNKNDEKKFYYARGALAGEILYLGPTYFDTVSSHRANKKWKIESEKIYASMESEATQELRQDDMEYSKLILDWDEAYLKRIQNVHSTSSFGFRFSAGDEDTLPDGIGELSLEEAGKSGEGVGEEEEEPRRFLATNSRIGFAPPGARVGDSVCQFWGTDVAVIIRRIGHEKNDRWEIVGKADLSQKGLRDKSSQKISEYGLNFDTTKFEEIEEAMQEWGFNDTMNLKMDLDVLQRLSS